MENLKNASLPTIALIGGTGKEGPGLAMRWAHVGYPIIIGSRQLEKAQRIASELNEKLGIDTIRGLQNNAAVQSADICVLTVAYTAHQAAIRGLKDDMTGKTLVDTTARIDFRAPKPPQAPSAARIAQDIVGAEVRVVAAFQNVPAHSLRKNIGGSIEADVLVCSDDPNAADEIIKLAEAGGMRAYYAGDLDNAVVVEGLTSILVSLNKHYGVKTASIGISGLDNY